jgi:SAM-dependent methyltransferase
MYRVKPGIPGQPFTFICPACQFPLEITSPDACRCPADGNIYLRLEGIWRFLLPERQAYFQQFIGEYEKVRAAEGRGSSDPSYYRALPFIDLSGQMKRDWGIRASSYRTLARSVLSPLERQLDQPPKSLDLGAGNAWLSYRLAQRGHQVAAVDLLTNPMDGLGAYIRYEVPMTPIQAEFDHLPLNAEQFDLVIFNASLHYSVNYAITLKEALRVLKKDGRVIILDSPVYYHAASGDQMVQERQARFRQLYGFPSNALPSQNYLTDQQLDKLASELGLHWRLIRSFYGIRWALRPWIARLRGDRETARFVILVGNKP